MSRRAFIGTAAVGAAAAGMGGVASAVGGDEPWENKIYPTADPATNRQNIVDVLSNPRHRVIVLMSRQHRSEGGMPMSFDLQRQDPIEVPRDVRIIGQGTKIVATGTVFYSNGPYRISMSNLHFFTPVGVSPFNFMNPAQGTVMLDLSSVAIGGDEPWE
jgi:hypothetical protein